MKASRVLGKLGAGEPALGIALHLTDPSVFEMASLMGFDAIWMDMEHHFYSLEVAAGLMRAARVGGADIIATGRREFMRMARMLEAARPASCTQGAIRPRRRAEVVKWAKFAPLGKRGSTARGPTCRIPHADGPLPARGKRADLRPHPGGGAARGGSRRGNRRRARRRHADARTGGFYRAHGNPRRVSHPTVAAAVEKVAEAAQNTGKHWAATCGSVEVARTMIKMGARLIFHGCDIVFVKHGLDQLQANFRTELGLRFDRPSATGEKSYLGGG